MINLTANYGGSMSILKNAVGQMPCSLKNDYMFRATLQTSNLALKGLTAALLHMPPEEVVSVEITNPVELGKSIEAKDFILDLRVLLNNETIVNMEMQVLNLGNWPERSLGYLCRSFDSLNRGQDYLEVRPVIQICFLDFTLFKDDPEFYSTYMFINVKKHTIYSDKLKLSVVDLTKIENATEEDRLYGIDRWARLFKATTWEEMKALAEQSDFLREASEAFYRLSAEEKIRLQCEAREEYYRQQRYVERRMKMLEEAEEKITIAEEKLAVSEEKLAVSEEKLAARDQTLAQKNWELTQKDQELSQKDQELAQKDQQLARLSAELEALKQSSKTER